MTDREPDPLERLEQSTVRQTDFEAYVRYLAKDGIPALLETEEATEPEEEKASRMKLLIGFTTARVLDNRKKAGLPNEISDLWGDPGITSWVQEFIVDERVKTLMVQGVVQGFEVAGLLPRNWRDLLPGGNEPK